VWRDLVPFVLAFGILAVGSIQGNEAFRIHRLERATDDPNPVRAHALATVHRSPERPVPFERIVLDSQPQPNGRKPKVIIDPDGRGGVAGALDGAAGFMLYPAAGREVLVSRGGEGEDAQTIQLRRDGLPDIVVGGLSGTTYLLLNPRHDGCADVYRCAWERRVVGTGHPSHDVVTGDLDRNGTLEIVTESGIYYPRPDGERWTFVGRSVVQRDGEGTSVGSFASDGILDIVAPYERGTKLARFINPAHWGADPTRTIWPSQIIDASPRFTGNMTTAVADVDGDGHNDIILAPMYGGGGLVWYRNPPNGRGPWRRHLIDPSVNFVHQGSLQIGDFTGTGRPDIAFAEQDQSPTRRVGVFYNVRGDGSRWRLQVLSTDAGHNIKVGYLGRDRLPTILSAPHGAEGLTNPLVAWRDVLPPLERWRNEAAEDRRERSRERQESGVREVRADDL
jgi:hypothetical protein